MRMAGFVTVGISLQKSFRDGSTFWLPAVGSLKGIFLAWHPQTSADLDQRETALKGIVAKYPDIGWNLLVAILPEADGFTTGTYKPTWQEWASDNVSVTYAKLFKVVEAIAALILENVGYDVQRWGLLLEHYNSLPPNTQAQLNERLANLPLDQLQSGDQEKLWDLLSTSYRKCDPSFSSSFSTV